MKLLNKLIDLSYEAENRNVDLKKHDREFYIGLNNGLTKAIRIVMKNNNEIIIINELREIIYLNKDKKTSLIEGENKAIDYIINLIKKD
jgi:hypothetical protein